MWIRITSNGPSDPTDAQAALQCSEKRTPLCSGGARTLFPPTTITLNLKAGQTLQWDTGLTVDTHVFKYTFTPQISPLLDPKSRSNSGSKYAP